jgi:glycosyltransferase involved in cell wall biosynthesis
VGIALCLVVKDEADRIEGAISPFLGHVDSICVLDNGSTDGTGELAAKMGAKVKRHVEETNMGKFRNMVDDMAPECEWKIHVDADERFDAGFMSVMKMYSEIHDCFSFPRINLPDGKDWPDNQVRFYKKVDGVRWERPMWNRLVHPSEPANLPHPILHLPRRPDIERPWWKGEKP